MVSRIINNKYSVPLFIIFLFFEFISINFAIYNYDSFHLGFIISSSSDLDYGKYIYKDFFYPYGFLNLYLNNILLNIFNFNILYLYIFYIQIYILGLFFFYLLVKKIINAKYAFFSLIVFFLIHPFILKPWHNYLLFFLLNIFIYLKYQKTIKNDLLGSFVLGICFLFSEPFLLASFLILILDLILSYRVFKFRNILYKIVIFFSPLLLFFLYLFYFNLYEDWLKSTETFSVLLGYFYKKNIIEYLISYLIVFFLSYKKILSNPYIFFYFLIFLTNIFYILYNFKNFLKKNDFKQTFLIFLSCLNLILISQTLNNISLFKLATLSTFGFVTLLYLIENSKDFYLKTGTIILLLSLCIMSFLNENLTVFKSQNKMIVNPKKNLDFVVSQKYNVKTWENLNYLKKTTGSIKTKCNIEYFVNFTNDAFYYYILNKNFNSLQYFYWFQNIDRNFQNTFYLSLYNSFNRGINKQIQEQIYRNNIIFVTDFYNQKKIKFISDDINFDYEFIEFKNYYFVNLPYSDIHKKKILLIPNTCKI